MGRYLREGGFLFIEGNNRFLREMAGHLRSVLGADGVLAPLPLSHMLYHSFYEFGGGFPGEDKARVANVGCFVDLIRLREVNPFYVWILLRSEPGWGQIRSLINGVGTPNINFGEIRSLRIPLIPAKEQSIIEERYRTAVWPHHRRGARRLALRERAWSNFQLIRSDLEAYLAGSSNTL